MPRPVPEASRLGWTRKRDLRIRPLPTTNLDVAYMQALEAKARADGIVVPLFHNDSYTGDHRAPGTPGG